MGSVNARGVAENTTKQRPALTMGFWRQTLRLCRPYSLLWFVTLPTIVMSLWLAHGSVDTTRLALMLLVAIMTDAGLTTWNDYCDVKTDSLSIEPQRNTRPLVAGIVSARWARTQAATLLILGLVTASFVSIWFSLLLLCFVLYGLVYSARPIYASGRPIISQLFWIILWPAMYLGIALVMRGDAHRAWLYLVGVVLFMGIGETLAKDLRDLDNDAQAAKNTTPVILGHQKTAVMSAAAFALGSVALIGATMTVPEGGNLGLTAAVTLVLVMWCGRALILSRRLYGSYDKTDARDLHVEAIRTFVMINLLFVVELAP